MGRGRQKAKQTKVARKLKYYSPETDLEALQRELSYQHTSENNSTADETDFDDDFDYSSYEIPSATDDDDDWEEWANSHRK